MASLKVSFVVLLVTTLGLIAAHDDDHSNHCHIDGFPSIHINIGEDFLLPGACLKLHCKENDVFEVIGICNDQKPKDNKEFAEELVAGKKCPN